MENPKHYAKAIYDFPLAIGGSAFSTNTPDNIYGHYTDKKGNTFQ